VLLSVTAARGSPQCWCWLWAWKPTVASIGSRHQSRRRGSSQSETRMGTCLAKTQRQPDSEQTLTRRAPESASATNAPMPTLLRQAVPSIISLDRVKALSSNATSVSSRYHCRNMGNGRRVEDDYEVFNRRVLGTGLSGNVVLAQGRHNGRRYALKRIMKSKVHQKALKQLTAEVEIYLTLDHPNIARLKDVYEDEAQVSLLTECCEGGELYARLSRTGTYAEKDAAEATRQMLRAVGYLHAHSVVHRDLKLENFLYESKEDNSPLKLIDFGFAKVWDPSTLMMASCGSVAYVSPDVLKGNGYTSKCDLWSLGVIVFMLLVGYPPFHGSEQEMRSCILAGKVDYSHRSRWKHVSRDAVDFVKRLLVKDPNDRLDVPGALKHKWLIEQETKMCKKPSVELPREALRGLRHYQRTSHVRRAVLQLLAQELAPTEACELRELFLSMDTNGEGTIRLSELKEAIRGPAVSDGTGGTDEPVSPPASMGAPREPMTPAGMLKRAKSQTLIQLFEVLDANGDEQIYYSDFLAATMDARTQLREETLRAAFHRLDADGSGTLSASDFRRVLGDTFEGVDVQLLANQADKTGKGEISFDDFLQLVEACDASPTPHARARAGLPSPAELLGSVE